MVWSLTKTSWTSWNIKSSGPLITASEGDGIPAKPFKILKYAATKVLHSIRQQIWKTHQWPQDWKSQFSFQSPKLAVPKNVQTTGQLLSFYMLATFCPKSFKLSFQFSSVQFSSVTQSCLTLCDPMNCSMPGLPVHHQLPEFTQTHVHRVGDAIQPSPPMSSPSPPAPNPSQHQSLFQ